MRRLTLCPLRCGLHPKSRTRLKVNSSPRAVDYCPEAAGTQLLPEYRHPLLPRLTAHLQVGQEGVDPAATWARGEQRTARRCHILAGRVAMQPQAGGDLHLAQPLSVHPLHLLVVFLAPGVANASQLLVARYPHRRSGRWGRWIGGGMRW